MVFLLSPIDTVAQSAFVSEYPGSRFVGYAPVGESIGTTFCKSIAHYTLRCRKSLTMLWVKFPVSAVDPTGSEHERKKLHPKTSCQVAIASAAVAQYHFFRVKFQ